MESYGNNGGWYNAQKILPYFDDHLIFWVVGARRMGKTDLMLRLACDLWTQYGKKTMWVRNKVVELSDPRFYSNFLNDAKQYGWCPDEWTVKSDGVYESDDKDAERVIDFQAISTFGNMRGGAHPKTVLMVLDEFMPEDHKYPKQCAIALMSATKTVFSGNPECRVFCLSNFTEGANPYFVQYQIYPEPGKDITLCPGRNLIERARGYRLAIDKANPWTDNYRQGGYADYASESEDPMMRLICKTPKGLQPGPWVLLANGVQYRYHYSTKKGLMYWDRWGGRVTTEVVYTPNLKESSDRVTLLPSWAKKQLMESYEAGVFRFASPNVMYAVMSCLYEAV